LHDSLVEVVDDSELLELGMIFDHILLHLLHFVIMVVENAHRHLIGVIVQVDETVVKEKATVAFLAIAVVNLLASLDIVQGVNYESTAVICIVPCSLSGAFMVQHICICNEAVGFNTINLNTKDSAGDHHADLRVLTDGELCKLWNFLTYQIVIGLNVNYFLLNLIQEGTSLEPFLFLVCEKDREIRVALW
jgi:hypothetical protein